MHKYLLNSKSSNTVNKYKALFNKWETFARDHNLTPLPANPYHVSLYLSSLLDLGSSKHSILPTAYAIKFQHDLKNFQFDSKHPFIKGIMEASKRQPCQVRNRKDPISREILISLCDKFKDCNDVIHVRDISIILLSFAGFFRFNEVSALKLKDVKFEENFMEIFLEKSKTDQYRDGRKVVIAKGSTSACPLAMLKKYYDLTGLQLLDVKGED